MAILDNRTTLFDAESAANFDDLIGVAAGALDTETVKEGGNSVGVSLSHTSGRDGLLYDNGTVLTLLGRVLYIWFNYAAPGLLPNKASGGIAIRVCGATVTDWKERYLAGKDTYNGGWVQFVIDIDDVLANSDAQNGTPPTANNIRYIGITLGANSTMPKMQTNYFLDRCWYVDNAVPALLVEAQNSGAVDWKWDDLSALSETNAWGLVKIGEGGSVILNGPIRFGANDGVTHGFSDTSKVVLWQQAINGVPASFYRLEVIGGSGTQSFALGQKSGAGASATGSQGCIIAADPSGDRWDFDCDDPNVDAANIYGCTLLHVGDFQFDDAAIECISNLFIDSTSGEASGSNAFLRNGYINSNTAIDTGSLTWNENVDVDGILDGSIFEQGATAHHAIDFGTAVTVDLTLRGIAFNGFGSVDDADASTLRFLATGGSLTLNLIDCTVDGVSPVASGGGQNFSIDDAAGIAVTVVVAPVTLAITCTNEADLQPIQDVQTSIHLAASPFTVLMNEDTTAGGLASESYAGSTPVSIVWKTRKSDDLDNPRFFAQSGLGEITTAGFTLAVLMKENTFLP